MKRCVISKPAKRKIIPYFSFFIILFIFTSIYKYLDNSPSKITDKQLVNYLLSQTQFTENKNFFYTYLKDQILNIYNKPLNILMINSAFKQQTTNKSPPVSVMKEETKKPLIYIYNSHQSEEYASSTFIEYSVKPTVMMADYILEEQFNNAQYPTLVEERSIKEVLNKYSWNYSYSYQASRIRLEEVKKNNPSLQYFIDVHRDSLSKERTTVEINGKKYAKLLFIIGLENPNYSANLEFTEAINAKLNERYPNLSKGIYKKSGPGVNGVYNQDFSPRTILIEMGGYQNTPTEVMNSALAFSECYLEVLKTYENV